MASSADDVLRESLARARRAMDGAVRGPALRRLLEQGDADLKRRLGALARAGTPGMRFTEAQMLAYQKQIEVVTTYVRARLLGLTNEQAERVIVRDVAETVRDLERLERAFTGIATPLRIREAAVMSGITDQVQATLLNQRLTSLDRYGEAMIGEFRGIMRRGLMTGVSQSQMVDALVGHGGPRGAKVSTAARVDPATGKVVRLREEDIPEGLFVRKRYWAERIVRTEVAHVQNEARLQTIGRAQAEDFPDMGKKILAVMDNRTALDSLAVHGQVRKPEELFMDGAGRQYLRPPARPNDREAIVPWRLSWGETPYSAPMPPKEVAEAVAGNEPPGQARRQKVQALQQSYEAQLSSDAKRAMRAVHRRIGTKLAESIGPAIAARALMDRKVATVRAQGEKKLADEEARDALQSAEAAAAARVQQVATADALKRAKAAQRAADARARAAAYRKRERAAERVRAVEKAPER